MRDAEADIAEALSNEGWLTVLDGPLHGIRHRRGLPVIGYVKTHHRRMLAREHWVRVPELTAGERSGLFAMGDALYGCYLRVGDPGPWAGPWAGIARLKMPSGIGRDAAVEAAERAAGWLPGFASALHRDARAPVNLTPIAGLERHLHRLQGTHASRRSWRMQWSQGRRRRTVHAGTARTRPPCWRTWRGPLELSAGSRGLGPMPPHNIRANCYRGNDT